MTCKTIRWKRLSRSGQESKGFKALLNGSRQASEPVVQMATIGQKARQPGLMQSACVRGETK